MTEVILRDTKYKAIYFNGENLEEVLSEMNLTCHDCEQPGVPIVHNKMCAELLPEHTYIIQNAHGEILNLSVREFLMLFKLDQGEK